MKKFFVTVLMSVFLLVSCQTTIKEEPTGDKFNGRDITVYTYDGCEYIYVNFGYAKLFTHKGDCKNPIHDQIVKSADLKFYGLDGEYRGALSVDSIVINYKTMRMESWVGGGVSFIAKLKDMGMMSQDLR